MIFRLLLVSLLAVSLMAKPYRGGELRTIESYQYGRFEVRMKSAPGSGVISSFFMYHDFWAEGQTSSSYWNEIDLEWLGQYDDKVHTNLIIQNGWDLPGLTDLSFDPSEDFHTYAIEWTSQYIAFFVDDQMIRWVDNFYADSMYHEQKLMMNIWPSTSVDWAGSFSASSLPTHAYYDWVKYYLWVNGTGNAGTDNNFILFWEDNFDSWDTNRWEKATHTWDGNNADFIPENVVFMSGYMILCLTTPSTTGYNGDPLSVSDIELPQTFQMHNAYPNPFNGEVVIPISLDQPQPLLIEIYNCKGEYINTLKNGIVHAGKTMIKWNGVKDNGQNVPSGVYFVRFINSDKIMNQKILFLK